MASKFDSTPQQAETKFRNVRTTYTKGFYERRRQYLLVLDGRPQKCSLSLRIWGGCLVILITKLSRTERPSAIVKDPQRPWKTLSDRERWTNPATLSDPQRPMKTLKDYMETRL